MKSRDDLADEVAEVLNLPKGQTRDVVTQVFANLAKGLQDGEDVRIHGFGTFSVKDTAARTARNPATGAPVEIAAGRKVSFKPASDLKKSV